MHRSSASALLLALLLPACSDSATLLPGTIKLLDDLPRVNNSTAAPCRLQREIAAQNSYLASIEKKSEVVYKAPCDVDRKPDKIASAEAVKASVR